MNEEIRGRASRIRLAVFDVDGVMTDGSLFLDDEGREYKAFNSLDGHGLKMLRRSGVELAIITGRTSDLVIKRAANLGIPHLYQGVENKLEAWQEVTAKLGLAAHETAFMGDDVIDLPPMIRCGLAITVPAAPPLVKEHAHYITQAGGGRGAVREVCELLMAAQGTLDAQMAQYLK